MINAGRNPAEWPENQGGAVGGFFQVDLEALQRFIDSLQQSGDHMESALNALKSVDEGQSRISRLLG